MKAAALILSLSSQLAWSGDELALFKESATQILVANYLGHTAYGAYVCISIEGKAPTKAQLASFQSLGIRDVGAPAACVCHKRNGDDECFRQNSSQLACVLSVSDFEFHAFTNASASVFQACGETNGDGEVARFEKRGEVWLYVGSVKRTVS